jgi:hypothetical protein
MVSTSDSWNVDLGQQRGRSSLGMPSSLPPHCLFVTSHHNPRLTQSPGGAGLPITPCSR